MKFKYVNYILLIGLHSLIFWLLSFPELKAQSKELEEMWLRQNPTGHDFKKAEYLNVDQETINQLFDKQIGRAHV